jgi:hypothetical protein
MNLTLHYPSTAYALTHRKFSRNFEHEIAHMYLKPGFVLATDPEYGEKSTGRFKIQFSQFAVAGGCCDFRSVMRWTLNV